MDLHVPAVVLAAACAPGDLAGATRETSILFAALIGWAFPGETMRSLRWPAIMFTLAGPLLAKLWQIRS